MAVPPQAVPRKTRAEWPEVLRPLGLTPYTLVLVALLVGAYVIFRREDIPAVAFSDDAIQDVGRVLAPLVLVAGFIERTVEVILTPLRGDDAARLKAGAKALRAADDSTGARELEDQLHDHRLASRRLAFFLAVGLGLLASLLGIRGIEGLLAEAPPNHAGIQFLDIVLTGFVIGGGAEGIHKMVKAFTDYMEMVSRKSQAT